ncbi:MAG: helix-turn-helix domain-containing protein [Alphaproteobacteria bacterium]|jgi:DNA-binding transcriptional regulator YiaG|nr:helix-turn-helix domain-containing protein [Alphaproteobacteria bacterium]
MERYHYTDCGLDNVWITGGFTIKETDYGKGISISHLDNLHRAIGLDIATSLNRINSAELRFLRVEMELSQKRLGELIGVDAQTIARWEKGEVTTPGPAELLIRTLYIQFAGDNPNVAKLCQDLAELDEIEYEARREFVDSNGDWRLAG